MEVASKRELELSGGVGECTTSARAGMLPISLERAPLGAFDGIAVYLRVRHPQNPGKTKFSLYCSERVTFNADHRVRLRSRGVQFVYIPIAEHARFRAQTEATLLQTAVDDSMSVAVRSEIVYETSVELVNELLTEPGALAQSPRLERVSRSIAMLVLNDRQAFSHLFATSHHDFYTATHMVNVGTWMVPLAWAMGHRGSDELGRICLAGLLHDVGKLSIAQEVLNKATPLTDDEWQTIRQHPEQGVRYLEKFPDLPPLIRTVALQHHERSDGSGYPAGLKADQIHPISRICAVVDSFDAMTALRPFKQRTMSVAQALATIARETPAHYDPAVVEAWLRLLQGAEDAGTLSESLRSFSGEMQRQYPRFRVECPARLHVLERHEDRWVESGGIRMTAHNISRGGIGLLGDTPLRVNETVRIYLLGRGTLRRSHEGLTVRCRAHKDGWFEIGVKFLSLVDEGELAGLSAIDLTTPQDALGPNPKVSCTDSR